MMRSDLGYRVDLALLELGNLKRELKELDKTTSLDIVLSLVARAEVAVRGIQD